MRNVLLFIVLSSLIACAKFPHSTDATPILIEFSYPLTGPDEIERERIIIRLSGKATLRRFGIEYYEYMPEEERSHLIAVVRDPVFLKLLAQGDKPHGEDDHIHIGLSMAGSHQDYVINIEDISPALKEHVKLLERTYEATFGYRYYRIRFY